MTNPYSMISIGANPIDQITDYIYIGTFGAAASLAYKNPEGIKHILNCTDEIHTVLSDKDFIINQISIWDGYPIHPDNIVFGILCIDTAVKNNEKIIVHCHAGISRSTSIVAAYLMFKTHCTWDQAVEQIVLKRPQVFPHPIVARSIKDFLGESINQQTTLLGEV